MEADSLKQKVEQLATALKERGLWKKAEPVWVHEYKENAEIPEVNFLEWLQFVYLPNLLLNQDHSFATKEKFITLQAKKFASEKMIDEKIVQLLVELDAL
jgi:uncharacterized protein YqcC (DUF446 family)